MNARGKVVVELREGKRSGVRRRGSRTAAPALLFLSLVLAGCCSKGSLSASREPPASDPPGPASASPPKALAPAASAGGDIDVRPWVTDWPTSWTDPRVVRALASSCAFVAKRPPPDGLPRVGGSLPSDPFACKRGYEQSCVVDPCGDAAEGCYNECERGCEGCGEACVSSCEACKASCTGEGCALRCAEQCAACREGCTRSMDRCFSGRCTREGRERYKQCRADLRRAWQSNGCNGKCRAYTRCQQRCQGVMAAGDDGAAYGACYERCERALDPKRYACTDACEAKGKADAEVDLAACFDACGPEACALAVCAGFGEPGQGGVDPNKLPSDDEMP